MEWKEKNKNEKKLTVAEFLEQFLMGDGGGGLWCPLLTDKESGKQVTGSNLIEKR